MADINPLSSYPLPSHASLLSQYLGQKLEDLPTPAVILDRAIIRRNCDAMLSICAELKVGFRAHVKSHKTLELSKMQVGESGPANFIVSTIAEAENLLPELCNAQGKGREASVCSMMFIFYFFLDTSLGQSVSLFAFISFFILRYP
jgi:hypothetical protein